MGQFDTPLPDFLAAPSRLGGEITLTGKWAPTKPGGFSASFFGPGVSSALVKGLPTPGGTGALSGSVVPANGQDASLVHQVFKDAKALEAYVSTALPPALEHARPELHLVRGIDIAASVRSALAAKIPSVSFGTFLYGYVKEDYRRPDPATAINVTAKWTCKPGSTSNLPELRYWWQRVGTDAHSMEKGLVRFEVYQVVGEDALIIHEVFTDTNELRFHLSKGTAHKYKKDIDQIAAPECYYFRGPVAVDIRVYSKFMHLPATYTRPGASFTAPGGSMSDGKTA